MSDILKAIAEDIESGAEWTKPKPPTAEQRNEKQQGTLPKISKGEAKRIALQLAGERKAAEALMKKAQVRLDRLARNEKKLRQQCPHVWGKDQGFEYHIYECVICGETEID